MKRERLKTVNCNNADLLLNIVTSGFALIYVHNFFVLSAINICLKNEKRLLFKYSKYHMSCKTRV